MVKPGELGLSLRPQRTQVRAGAHSEPPPRSCWGAAPDQANARNQICSLSQLVFEVLFISGIFLTFKKLSLQKLNGPENSRIFQAKKTCFNLLHSPSRDLLQISHM